MVNINLIIFNSKWMAIKANLKTSSSQVSTLIPYKVDTGSDVMPLHLYKKMFSRAKKDNWQQPKLKSQIKNKHTTK